MEQENATPTGVFTPAHAGRASAMAEIAAQVNAQNAPDMASFDEETGEIVKPPAQETVKDEPVQTAEVQHEETATEQAPVVAADDGLETIVIDGQERKVKRDQIIEAGRRTLQKESAADRRLEEAAETLRRAKAYEQGIMQRQPSSDAGGEQQASSDPANGNGVSRQHQATPDIGTLVDQRLWIHDANKAATRFSEEFKDIADDPYAARLVAQLEDERLRKAAAEGKPLGDPWDAYKAHGEQIRQWLGKAKPAGAVVPVSDDKAERKRSTVTVTGSTTSRPAPVTPKTPTTNETIERMRLARMGKATPIKR